MNLRQLFKRKAKEPEIEVIPVNAEITAVNTTETPEPRGGIRKTRPVEFSPDVTRRGGRIVRTMPRTLRQMKDVSEKTDD